MTNDTETITGEVVDSAEITKDSEGVQFTVIDLFGESESNQYSETGEYKLVRVSDDD